MDVEEYYPFMHLNRASHYRPQDCYRFAHPWRAEQGHGRWVSTISDLRTSGKIATRHQVQFKQWVFRRDDWTPAKRSLSHHGSRDGWGECTGGEWVGQQDFIEGQPAEGYRQAEQVAVVDGRVQAKGYEIAAKEQQAKQSQQAQAQERREEAYERGLIETERL